jgi:membrane protein DedA with SNARE-associated domain
MFGDIGDYIEVFIKSQLTLAPVLLLTLEEAGIPVPIPGDIVIAFVGYQASLGKISYVAAFFILLTAVLTGSSILYYLSSHYGNRLVKRFGPYLHINEEKLHTVERQFKRFGPLVIIFGRHIPGFRIPITIFSGMSGVSFRTFFLSTIASVIIWIPVNLALGAKLGHRTVKLFEGHTEYFYLISIPFIVFIIYMGNIWVRQTYPKLFKKKHKEKKISETSR